MWTLLGTHAAEGVAESLGAAPQSSALVVGHARWQRPFDARAAEHGGQGKADTVVRLMDADGKHGALVPEDRLSQPCRDDADPVLAGADALDDRDIRVAHLCRRPTGGRCARVGAGCRS